MSRVKRRIKQRDEESSTTVGLSIHHEFHDVDKNLPIFFLRYLQKGYCLGYCQKREKVTFIDRLFRLSQISQDEIRKSGKHGFGTEEIIRDAIEAPIPKHVTRDVGFVVFRFCSKAPMVGYKIGVTFYVL